MATPLPGEPVRRKKWLPAAEEPLFSDAFSQDVDPDDFWAKYQEIEEESDRLLQQRLQDQYAYDPFRMRISGLSSDDQGRLINQMDELIGLQDLTNQGLGPNMFRNYYDSEGKPYRSPAGRMVFNNQEFTNENIDPRILALSQTTIRFDNSRSSIVGEKYFSAGSPYRAGVLQHSAKVLQGGIDTSKPGMVFDVETPGLNPEEGIWQLSARFIKDGEAIDRTFHFNNPKMRFGTVYDAAVGDTKRLDQFLMGDTNNDFVDNMKEFMAMSKDAEWVGGHNIFFDYGMLARSLTKHQAYHVDPDFKDLTDSFLSKFHTGDGIGNVIDTNVLTRMMLPHITLASELKDSETPYQFSLQNILLQTDLLPKLKKQGVDIDTLLSQGLHYADVDVPFETHLLNALTQHYKSLQNDPEGEELQVGDHFLTPEQRLKIVTSSAITPNTRISDPDMIIPDLKAKFGNDIKLTPMEQMVLSNRRLDKIPEDAKMTDDLDLASKINTWDRVATIKDDKGWITPGGQLATDGRIPTMTEWAQTQEDLAKKGIPLPGMSWMERHVAAALGETRGPGMGEQEAAFRSIFGADVAPLGRFVQRDGINVIGRSQLVQMPYSVIKDWRESEGTLESSTNDNMAYLSPFKITSTSAQDVVDHKYDVGLIMPIQEEEQDSLLRYLQNRDDVDTELGGLLEQAFTNNTGTYGVQIGTLGDLQGGADAEKIHRLLASIAGRTVDASDQTPQFWTHIADNIGSKEGGGPIYTAGAFMRPDLMDKKEKASLPRQVVNMVSDYKIGSDRTVDSPTINMFKGMKRAKGNQQETEKLFKSLKFQKRIAEKGAWIGAGAAVIGAGLYAEKHHHENKQLDETYALMPYENSNFYAQNQNDAIPQDPNTPPNYLATANTVSQLDASKIGHTQMGQQRYNYLYRNSLTA